MQTTDTDFSDCKLIFSMMYFPTNNDWNLFKNIQHIFHRDITIEWGIHIQIESICPLGVRPLLISEVLTSEVEDDLIKYTCSSACGDDANICDNTYSARFESWLPGPGYVQVLGDFHLAIHDLKVLDSCAFLTYINPSSKFCAESWADVETVEVPTEIERTYPQFITIPEVYRFDKIYISRVRQYICDEMRNNSQTCCVRGWDNPGTYFYKTT